jgi:hypothetical protein
MGYDFWRWLTTGQNSAALQMIAALSTTALAIVTIILLQMTWRASTRQARSAYRAAEAAENAANMSIKQLYYSVAASDMSLQPLISITLDVRNPSGEIHPGSADGRIKNVGSGPALEIEADYTGAPNKRGPEFVASFLGAGVEQSITYNKELAGTHGLSFKYKSAHQAEHETRIEGGNESPNQHHILVKQPYAGLADLQFRTPPQGHD